MTSTQQFQIRKARIQDLEDITSIEREAYGTCSYDYVVLRQFVDVSPSLFLVAEATSILGYVVGMVSADAPSECSWVLSLVVSSSSRKQGVGSRLAQALISRFSDLNVKSIYLTVAPTNAGAQKLYTNLGFSYEKRVIDYFGPEEDRLIFQKHLNSAQSSSIGFEKTNVMFDNAGDITEFLNKRVHQYYWKDDLNCATVVLKNLSETFGVPLDQQVLDAALGMHGAGGYRAQCGLVEGTLLFIGIFGRKRNISDKKIIELCRMFAETFEDELTSLLCRKLRPEGFSIDNPPHLCESLTIRANALSISFIKEKVLKEI